MFRVLRVVFSLGAVVAAAALSFSQARREAGLPFEQNLTFDGSWHQQWQIEQGQGFEIQVGIVTPSSLPANGRVEVRWEGPELTEFAFAGERGDLNATATADWRKTLHALDPDVYLVYRAPRAGSYRLTIEAVTDREQPAGEMSRDTGLAPLATPAPSGTPAVRGLAMTVALRPVEGIQSGDILLETEPNSTPEQAIPVQFPPGDGERIVRVIGGADELEYYNNAASGKSPDDWYRIEYKGEKPRILTANLQMAEPIVSARLRIYQPGEPSPEDIKPRALPDRSQFGNANPVPYIHPPAEVIPGPFPIYSYFEGRDINERIHQQDDNFRSFLTRKMKPGGVYYLRVEANQPGYELELRLVDPAPFTEVSRALDQSIYYQLAEIDAWLIHRPRNIALHRRVRDGTSLFGENCMSCHTQSGVWGVADAMRQGYRMPSGTVQSWRRLVNTMYESLRPTIKLEDAASNTSLAPNDLGDAPAGSRVAGRNIVLHERTFRPKKLQSYQQRRTANYVLQTADPQGINAAGKGSNFGPNVVFKFAAEVLDRAWQDTGEAKYFFGIEEKAKKIVETGDNRLKVVDDLGHRIEFFHRLFPKNYVETVERLTNDAQRVADARKFQSEFEQRVEADLKRLLALQQDDGSWGFDLGTSSDEGKSWTRMTEPGDPAATAVSLLGLQAAGYKPGDPVVAKAVKWLLANQFEYGLWNASAQTGFVTNAYVIRALSLLFPQEKKEVAQRREFAPRNGQGRLLALSRMRGLQATGNAESAGLMIEGAASPYPQVRYYALLGLGGALAHDGVPTLIAHLDDPVKTCREAAFWSLRQLLLDDTGWEPLIAAYRSGNDRTRQSILQALVTRVDLLGPNSKADLPALENLLTSAMRDSFAGVRSWAFKAAWHWWVWNPPLRDGINRAWVAALAREENESLVEMAMRYSTASLLIVNGQIANQTGQDNLDQQYPELARLYGLLAERREKATPEEGRRLDRRLTAVAASHFQERGNDGGPGQLGYSTPGSSELIGRAVLSTYERDADGAMPWKKIALEGASNVNYAPLQQRVLTLLQTGDLDLVAVAARALSNPQALSLPASPATLRPLLEKVERFLAGGRKDDAEALINFLARVKWDFSNVSETQEQEFYRLLIPGEQAQRGRTAPSAAAPGVLGRPAPSPAAPPDGDAARSEKAALLGRILGDNQTLQRKLVFGYVEDGAPEFWLPSTEWMASFQEGGPTMEEAVEGATEAEDLAVAELTFGRTTQQIVPDGLTSKNTILWWREGIPGARLSFQIEAPEAGRYDLISAFLYDREMGVVQFALNGEDISEPTDFYKRDLSATGPASLGIHEFKKGVNLLTVKMVGSNPDAEPNHIFGIDYVKLEPDQGAGSMFTKDERGVDVIDPVIAAKDQVIAMFTGWFSKDTPEEKRRTAVRLANKTALRRNPEVRKVLAEYVDQEPVPDLRESIQNILNSDDEVYGEQLRKFIVAQGESHSTEVRRLEPAKPFIEDILYFRDYVFAEMTKINDSDNKACISCHGVPGRVPTLYLDPPDAAGYIPPEQLLANYRKMQQRVDLNDVEASKLLRKPLNIQTGEEDGHQGGVRFQAEDSGYQVIREWVIKQAKLQSDRPRQ